MSINFSFLIIHKDVMSKGGQNDKTLSHLHLQIRMEKALTLAWKGHASAKAIYKPMMGHTRWRKTCTYCKQKINWRCYNYGGLYQYLKIILLILHD